MRYTARIAQVKDGFAGCLKWPNARPMQKPLPFQRTWDIWRSHHRQNKEIEATEAADDYLAQFGQENASREA
jgi:hypothetical protein